MSDQIRFWELKGKKLTLYFLADEVSSDESQALQALSNYWVTQIARNKDILKRAPPKNQQEEDFYNKYCDKEGKLSITAATHLMRYSVYRVNRGFRWFFFYVSPLRYKSTSNQPSGRAAPVNIGQSNLLDFPHDYLAM